MEEIESHSGQHASVGELASPLTIELETSCVYSIGVPAKFKPPLVKIPTAIPIDVAVQLEISDATRHVVIPFLTMSQSDVPSCTNCMQQKKGKR